MRSPTSQRARSSGENRPRRSSATLLVVCLVVAFVVPLMMIAAPSVSASPAWWNTSWTRRRPITVSTISVWTKYKPITITGSHPENYQIKIVIPYDSDMRSDYGDLRFTENVDNGELNYWIENYTADNATVWVKRLENTDDTIYVHYGNPNASSAESALGVFDSYSGFEDGALNPFTGTTGSGYFSVSTTQVRRGSYAAMANDTSSGSASGRYSAANTFWSENKKVIEMWVRSETTSTTGLVEYYLYREGMRRVRVGIHDNGSFYYTVGSTLTYIGSGAKNENLWYKFILRLNLDDSTYDFKVLNENFVTLYSVTGIAMDSTASATTDVMMYTSTAAVGLSYHDEIFSRKWASSEPTTSVGSEASGVYPRDYQLKIILSFYDNSIRFLENETSGVLNYWVENYTPDNMTVWVRRLENSTPDDTIYVYYGNPSATSESDVNMTFIRVIDNVVGSWSMDEGTGTTTADNSGNGNLGKLEPTGSEPTWTAGKFGSALNFDGTNDQVNCENNVSLLVTPVSVEAWINPATGDIPANGRRSIVTKYSTTANTGWILDLADDSSVEGYRFWVRGTANKWVSARSIGWTHVVGTYDNVNIRLYVDSILRATAAQTGNIADSANVIIGSRQLTPAYFNGLIDEVRIYDRALSAAEIFDIYNNYGYVTPNYPGKVLVRKWVTPEPTTSVGSEEELLLGWPQLISPADGAVTSDNTPTFAWTIGENADNHRLLVDEDPDFSSPAVDKLLGASDDSYTLIDAEALSDGTYYWKIQAIQARGQTSSSVWTFAVRVTTTYPQDWVERAHVSRATIAFDALPSRYRENLDESLLRAAAVAPDYWRLYGAESESTFTHSRDNAAYWLRRALDNYKGGNYDNALYDMGIAAYYIGDAMTLPRNDNIWENAQRVQHPSGWSLYRHFQEQARYYVPTTPSPRSWRPTLDEYIENYMLPYLDNYAGRAVSDWSRWVSTRDCGYVKSASDNAAQLIYDAWYSLLYECIGSAGGGGGLGPASRAAGALDGGAVEARWSFGLLSFGFGAALFFTAVIFTRRSSLGGHRRKRCLRRDRRGVSPVVGAVLVFSILVIASTTFVTHWIPELELKNEMDHTDAALNTWRKLQQAILNHENARIEVKLGADPASILGLFEQAPSPGTITVTPAKYVMRILPSDDAYVGDDGSSGSDLWVQTYKDNNRRAYIKFNISSLENARIYEARLVMNAKISSFPHTWNGKTGYSPVPMLVAVRKVDDDSWSEGTISWANKPDYGDALVNEDKPSENTWDISYEDDVGMWYTFNVSSYVKGEQAAGDYNISFCLKAAREDSTLKRYAWFRSKESAGYRPYLQITYSSVLENWRSFDTWGSIADSGSVVFDVPNKRYDQYSFVFEGGALIKEVYRENPILGAVEQEGYEPPQQPSPQTGGPIMVANPPLVVGQRLEGDNVKIYVNRYRIVNNATYTGTGKAFLNVTVRENADLRVEENLDNVMVAIRSDRPKVWVGTDPLFGGGYFTGLAGVIRGENGSLDYLFGAESSVRDFYANAITIYGLKQDVGIKDIIYVERVYDVTIDITT